MKRGLILSFVTVGLVVLCGSWTAAIPDDNRSDFALFDGTNPANPATGAVCGVRTAGKAFTFYVTVTNHSSGAAGFVRLTYKDGDFVQFPIAPNASFSFSQAGGSKGGADVAVRVSGSAGTKLVGAVSILGGEDGQPFCVSCDGTGDADCDHIIPD